MIKRVSIRDVAHQMGYSTATVSMALSNHARLPRATRETIQQAAREMGYSPDPVLASFAASRWHGHPSHAVNALAIIKDARKDAAIEGEPGLRQYAATLGYRLESFSVRDHDTGRHLSDILYSRGILGVAVGQIFTPGFCDSFDWSKFASVAISEGDFRPPIHLVMPDHFRAVQGSWDYAVSCGFQRIGMVIFDMPHALDFHDRRAALADRQADVPADGRIPLLTVESWNSESPAESAKVAAAVKRWVDCHTPDCVLGFNEIFWWVLRDIGWRGLSNPNGFVSLWKHVPSSQCPGFLLSPDEVGRRGLDWLDSLLRTGRRGLPDYPATMEIEMRWEPGKPQRTARARGPRATGR